MKIKKIIKIFFCIILFVFLAVILYFGGIIIYDTSKDYKPESKEKINISGKACYDSPDTVISLLSWNIGYCGLGKDMDFFYDGGKKVRPSREDFQKYLNGVINKISGFDTIDIIMLQEVDTSAKRSYYTNEADLIKKFKPLYTFMFAKNYDVRFVPLPVYNPMGSVLSGMITLSKINPVEAYRYSYHSSYAWPKNVMMLDRCLIYTRYNFSNGKKIIVLNTHNSAFDDAVELREVEAYIIKSIMLDEYARGNYVIAGGDWNRNPPDFNQAKISDGNANCTASPAIDTGFLPKGWKWIYDKSKPSNRNVNEAYKKGKTKTTVIDYFVVSPNVEVLENKTISDDFEFSDHQPVFMRIKLKTDTIKPDTSALIKKEKIVKKKKIKTASK